MEENLDEKKCSFCETPFADTDKFCGKCGFPLIGSDKEKAAFTSNYKKTVDEKLKVKKNIKGAIILLYLVAGFTVIQALILYFQDKDNTVLIVNLFVAAIFGGLGFWAKYKAFAAIFIGLLFYLVLQILSAILEPQTIYRGIFFKVFIVIAFIRAAYDAYKYKIS